MATRLRNQRISVAMIMATRTAKRTHGWIIWSPRSVIPRLIIWITALVILRLIIGSPRSVILRLIDHLVYGHHFDHLVDGHYLGHLVYDRTYLISSHIISSQSNPVKYHIITFCFVFCALCFCWNQSMKERKFKKKNFFFLSSQCLPIHLSIATRSLSL